ncbi:hypothetical protein TNCV_2052791 [Trichonephila clavipes]|nr:hypothetical protein TNCV_2052791 [Trichonephila clavipes]
MASEEKETVLTFRIALARQIIGGYFSRKSKERPASFQANNCVVLDDVRLASVGNLLPNYMCAECYVPLCIATCSSPFRGK